MIVPVSRYVNTVFIAMIIVVMVGCTARRMAPFTPHRTDSDVHRSAKTNVSCLECHEIASLSNQHKTTDDCMTCHRILHGDL